MAGSGQLESGTRVGRYLIGTTIGAGNMGVVYAAFDPELDRTVAIKVVRPAGVDPTASNPSHAEGDRRLLREAQALAKLAHPNVVKVHDVGTFDGGVFIAMEYLDGETLAAWFERARPSPAAVLAAFRRAGEGLACAHEADLVHRDFKPDNVLIDDRGRVVVTDFGLARSMGDPEALITLDGASDEDVSARIDALSRTGALVGTPAYMAPELLAGGQANALSDQFAFCVSLYEALYGRRPYDSVAKPELRRAMLRGRIDAPPPGSQVPQRLRRIVVRGLSGDPTDRFDDMRALIAALRPRRLPWPLIAGAGLAAVGATVFGATHQPAGEATYCDSVAEQLDGIWDDDARARLRKAFAGTNKSFAADSAERVVAGLDAYAQRWVDAQTEACKRSSQAPTAAAMACLSNRFEALEALAAVVTEGDGRTVRSAIEAVARLPPLEACNGAIGAEPSLPPELADAVAPMRKALARSRALRDAGLIAQAVEEAEALVAEAGAVGYAPVLAAAEVVLANALADAGRVAEAEAAYHRGLSSAVASQDQTAIADAAAGLAYLADEHDDEANIERWVAMGNAALDASPKPNVLRRAQLLSVLGNLQRRQGQLAKAEETHRRALAAMEGVVPEGNPAFAPHYASLGLALSGTGRREQGEELSARATELLRLAYGDAHPQYAAAMQNAATAHIRRGAYAHALAAYQTAHEITLAASGPEHPSTGTTAYSVASALLFLGRHAEARPFAEQARHAYEVTLGPKASAVAMVWALVGENEMRAGELSAAEPALRNAIEIAKHTDDATRHASYVSQLGNLQRLAGDFDAAAASLEEARAHQATLDDGQSLALAETLGRLAKLALDRSGHAVEAKRHAERSWSMVDALESDLNARADAALVLGRAIVAGSPTAEAKQRATDIITACLDALDELGEPSSRADALTDWLAAR